MLILWSVFYLEGVQCLPILEEQPMMWLDPLDRQSAQVHRLTLLVAEVLIEKGMVLAVSEFLEKRGTIPHESATLDEEEKAVLSSGIAVVT